MKSRVIILVFLYSGILLNAQEAYRQLIITEASLGKGPMAYLEITNVGDETINLSDFELGKVTPWTSRTGYESGEPLPPLEDWFNVPLTERMMLPGEELAPGESWVIANVSDWRLSMERIDPFLWRERESRLDFYDISDYQMHYPEPPSTPPANDSIDPRCLVMSVWNGRDCWYLRHHFINGDGDKDSVVIDQVGGVFDQPNGTNADRAYDVAGIPNATYTHKLIRKASVSTGNINFNTGRGVDSEDSEWMSIPRRSPRHHSMWHIGNHGSFDFDKDAFVSENVEMDWDDEVITVPWGIQRDDSLAFQFDKVPGLAWYYRYVPNHADSAYLSARTGDTVLLIMLGDEMQVKEFRIEVLEPGEDANIVIPKKSPDFATGWFGRGSGNIDNARFRATWGHEMDTIKHQFNIPGIAFATRVDTLFRYLEKAPNAEWEIIWVDETERVDLKHGDILRVTAENGDVKDYFIKMENYRPSDNAFLASITWPDIPEEDRGMFGWVGDTIPGFSPTVYSYTLRVPADVDGMPALIARTQQNNASIEVTRATSYAGPTENRTVTFKVTAENGTTVRTYTVLLEKEKLPEHIQPYEAEPLISEFIFWEQWNNGYVEIANTGNQVLDLSDYLFVNANLEGPATTAIEWGFPFHERYRKYVPGYKWTDQAGDWENEPYILQEDPAVSPIVFGGDVFTMGHTVGWAFARDYENWNNATWWVPGILNIDFGYETIEGERVPQNPWGEDFVNPETDFWGNSAAREWKTGDFYVFKILNDSVKMGLKPANDPLDFELIEIFGTGNMDEYDPVGNGAPMISSFVRKPEYVFPNPVPNGSFADNEEDSEWVTFNQAYWFERQIVWPQQILYITLDLGRHSFIPATHYMSTVTSLSYIVSPGYSDEEWIRGIITGTTVADFLGSISKADPDQTLSVVADGDTLAAGEVFADGDALHVMSADSTNITIYNLIVTEEGLKSNAVLTSDDYDIEIDEETGIISGFEMGTLLRTICEGVALHDGASLTIVDNNDAYVPFKRPNFNNDYVDVKATDRIFFDVVAEDGETRILYQLIPDYNPNDAFVTSEAYHVDQTLFLIDLIPEGTNPTTILSNLTPSLGASTKVVDKLGHERTKGSLYKDDRILVTSKDNKRNNYYYLSLLGEVPDYLAYLVSNIYEVDRLTLTFYVRVDKAPKFYELLNKIQIPSGSTIGFLDAEGNWKSEDDIVSDGDKLKVTAADNVTEFYYLIRLIINTYTLLYSTDGNGLIMGDTTQIIEYGSDGTMIEAIPNTGYHFVQWSDGETANPRLDKNVTSDIAVNAQFEINVYDINIDVYPHGSGTISGEGKYEHYETVSLSATPNNGFIFEKWIENGLEYMDNPLIFKAQAARSLTAYFTSSIISGTDIIENKGISVYPNPADDVIFILGTDDNASVYIYDLTGKLIITRKPVDRQIMIHDLLPGVYIIKISTGDLVLVNRFIKQ